MKRFGSTLLLAVSASISLVGADARADDIKHCLRFSFDGEFTEGQDYRRDIGNGLVFHAEPTEGGWHYEIGRNLAAGADDHYIYDLTLPLHGRHVTDLDTSYGTPAQDAVSDEPLYFWFVAFPQDGDKAEQGQQMVHWPKTEDEEQRGWSLLGSLPKGRGQLEMLKWRLSPGTANPSKTGDAAQYGALQWLQFRLTLTVPVAYALPADASATPLPCPAEEKDWPFESMAPAKP